MKREKSISDPWSRLETLPRNVFNSNFNYSNIYICWQINFKINLTKKKREREREFPRSKLVSNFKAPSAISELLLCNNNKGDRIDRADVGYLLYLAREIDNGLNCCPVGNSSSCNRNRCCIRHGRVDFNDRYFANEPRRSTLQAFDRFIERWIHDHHHDFLLLVFFFFFLFRSSNWFWKS